MESSFDTVRARNLNAYIEYLKVIMETDDAGLAEAIGIDLEKFEKYRYDTPYEELSWPFMKSLTMLTGINFTVITDGVPESRREIARKFNEQ